MRWLLIFLMGCMVMNASLAVRINCTSYYEHLVQNNVITEIPVGDELTQGIRLTRGQLEQLKYLDDTGSVIKSRANRAAAPDETSAIDAKYTQRLNSLGFKADHQYTYRTRADGTSAIDPEAVVYVWRLQENIDMDTYRKDYLPHLSLGETKLFRARYNRLHPAPVPVEVPVDVAVAYRPGDLERYSPVDFAVAYRPEDLEHSSWLGGAGIHSVKLPTILEEDRPSVIQHAARAELP